MKRIAVVGTGYVGLVTGVVLADLGNRVICVDNDPAKVAKIRQGTSPIYEPGIEEYLERNLREGRLTITTSVAEAVAESDIVFIAVGTPPGEDGTPDMSAVKAVAWAIGSAIQHPIVVVNKSTVPVGSASLVERLMLDAGAAPDSFAVVSNPEFLREGTAIHDSLHPDRVVIGASRPQDALPLIELFEPLNAPVLVTDLESAELIKYASNAFLAMKISFINAISRVCELSGANVGDVAKGIGLDARIGTAFLQAGLGWGGSCLPKDTAGLIAVSQMLGYDLRLLKAVVQVNEEQTLHWVDRIEARLGGLEGKTIAILGLAFKPNTDDIRAAKSLVMIEEILGRGGSIRAYDPIAMGAVRAVLPDALTYTANAFEAAEGADAAVLVTEWNEFKQLDLAAMAKRMAQPILFDGRRIYKREAAQAAGLEYFTVGERA